MATKVVDRRGANRQHNPKGVPLAYKLARLPKPKRDKIIESAGDDLNAGLQYAWDFWARPEQLVPPGVWWWVWLYLAGRGAGKTRTGAETINRWAMPTPSLTSGTYRRFGLVGPTAGDVRDVMIEGESGILETAPPDRRPHYEPSKLRLTWPNGAVAWLRSAEKPDRLRGPQAEVVWCDELAAWMRLNEAWTNLNMAIRLGALTRFLVTTTPKPKAVVRELISDANTVITRGSTYDNAPNLADNFIIRVRRKYEGTRTGRQELHGEVLEEAEGALWTRSLLELLRRRFGVDRIPAMARIVIALDPADGKSEGDEMAIAVAGLGLDHHYYVWWSEGSRVSPRSWMRRAVQLRHHYRADRIIAEVNHGGAWIEAVLRTVDANAPYLAIHAAEGKRTRAEPVAALYEQRRVHHVMPTPVGDPAIDNPFAELEDQMTNHEFKPGEPSPDRLDAAVWAIAALQQGVGDIDVGSHTTTRKGHGPPSGITDDLLDRPF
jgi:phage terminase large subunit-like protein